MATCSMQIWQQNLCQTKHIGFAIAKTIIVLKIRLRRPCKHIGKLKQTPTVSHFTDLQGAFRPPPPGTSQRWAPARSGRRPHSRSSLRRCYGERVCLVGWFGEIGLDSFKGFCKRSLYEETGLWYPIGLNSSLSGLKWEKWRPKKMHCAHWGLSFWPMVLC